MADKFDPYHKWLGIPPRDQPPHHYRLLSLDLFEADPEVIDAAAKRLATYVKSCAMGPHATEARKLLTEIIAARACLLSPSTKAAYDQRLAAPPTGPAVAPPIASPPVTRAPARAVPIAKAAAAGASPTGATRGITPNKPAVARPAGLAKAVSLPPPAPAVPVGKAIGDDLDDEVEDEVEIEEVGPPEALPELADFGQAAIEPVRRSKPGSGSHRAVPVANKPAVAVGGAAPPADGQDDQTAAKRRRANRRTQAPLWVVALVGVCAVIVLGGIGFAVWSSQRNAPAEKVSAPAIARGAAGEAAGDSAPAAESNVEAAAAADSGVTPRELAAPVVGAKRSSPVQAAVVSAAPNPLVDLIAADGSVDDLKGLLASDAANLNVGDAQGQTPLRLATKRKRPDLVQALLAAGAKSNVTDAQGQTPLMSAVQSGDLESIGLLLKAKADANAKTLATAPDGGGLTALHIAVRYGREEAVDLLLAAGAKCDEPNQAGVTPLMVAAWRGEFMIFKVLESKGAKLNAVDEQGQTPLMYAAASHNPALVQWLLDRGAVPTAKTTNGATALGIALTAKDPAVISKLRQALKESAPVLDF